MGLRIVDNRDPEKLRSRKPSVGLDIEQMAANVIARLTGETVEFFDDGSEPSTPDLLIHYDDGREAVCEVTTDTDQAYAAALAEFTNKEPKKQLLYPRTITLADSDLHWQATMSRRAKMKNVHKAAPALLRRLSAAHADLNLIYTFSRLVSEGDATAGRLRELGFQDLCCWEAADGEAGTVQYRIEGSEAPVGPHWDDVLTYVETLAASDKWQDNRNKLKNSGLDERHIFLGISRGSPGKVVMTLSGDYRDLPRQAPRLPPEISHLWVAPEDFGLCILWDKDHGWRHAEDHWAPGL